MLESNLVAGAQKFPQARDQLVFGQSITDACIDWETTEELILRAADALK
jgi:3-deoxy-7-phosphoheptulonate synthase